MCEEPEPTDAVTRQSLCHGRRRWSRGNVQFRRGTAGAKWRGLGQNETASRSLLNNRAADYIARVPLMTRSHAPDGTLGDFTADRRIIALAIMAAVIGAISAFVALALVRLIGLFTNLAYFHRVDTGFASPGANTLGLWAAGVPMLGGLVVGLLARYGSEKIRGHGIPEAMEAILIGRSRIEPKVAVLKPLSTAIAIGTGGPFGAEGRGGSRRRSGRCENG